MALTLEERCSYKDFSKCTFIPLDLRGFMRQGVPYGTLLLPDELNLGKHALCVKMQNRVKDHPSLCDRCPGRGNTCGGRVLEIPVGLT